MLIIPPGQRAREKWSPLLSSFFSFPGKEKGLQTAVTTASLSCIKSVGTWNIMFIDQRGWGRWVLRRKLAVVCPWGDVCVHVLSPAPGLLWPQPVSLLGGSSVPSAGLGVGPGCISCGSCWPIPSAGPSASGHQCYFLLAHVPASVMNLPASCPSAPGKKRQKQSAAHMRYSQYCWGDLKMGVKNQESHIHLLIT